MDDFVSAILEMNYGTLRSICDELSSMIEDKEVRPKLETSHEFADLLFDWAESKRDNS